MWNKKWSPPFTIKIHDKIVKLIVINESDTNKFKIQKRNVSRSFKTISSNSFRCKINDGSVNINHIQQDVVTCDLIGMLA